MIHLMKLFRLLGFFYFKKKKSDALLLHFKYTYILKTGEEEILKIWGCI